jgi:hypothetical protein
MRDALDIDNSEIAAASFLSVARRRPTPNEAQVLARADQFELAGLRAYGWGARARGAARPRLAGLRIAVGAVHRTARRTWRARGRRRPSGARGLARGAGQRRHRVGGRRTCGGGARSDRRHRRSFDGGLCRREVARVGGRREACGRDRADGVGLRGAAEVRAVRRARSRRSDPVRFDRRGARGVVASALDLAPELARSRPDVPLLVAHDPSDGEVPFSDGETIATLWNGARLFAAPGAGHGRILGDPRVRDEAVAFLTERAS